MYGESTFIRLLGSLVPFTLSERHGSRSKCLAYEKRADWRVSALSKVADRMRAVSSASEAPRWSLMAQSQVREMRPSRLLTYRVRK